jgi:hypothetical protein
MKSINEKSVTYLKLLKLSGDDGCQNRQRSTGERREKLSSCSEMREREREREREEWWCHNGEIGLLWLRKRERAGSSGGGNNGGRERDERRSKGQKGRKRGGGEVLID